MAKQQKSKEALENNDNKKLGVFALAGVVIEIEYI